MEQGLGNMGDAVRPGTQGIRGWLWSPLLCVVTRYREGGTAGSGTSSFRKVDAPSHRRGQLAAVKVRVDSFASWEELVINETAAAPPNTEHERLLETVALRFDLASPTPSVCSGSLGRSIFHRRSPGNRGRG